MYKLKHSRNGVATGDLLETDLRYALYHGQPVDSQVAVKVTSSVRFSRGGPFEAV